MPMTAKTSGGGWEQTRVIQGRSPLRLVVCCMHCSLEDPETQNPTIPLNTCKGG